MNPHPSSSYHSTTVPVATSTGSTLIAVILSIALLANAVAPVPAARTPASHQGRE